MNLVMGEETNLVSLALQWYGAIITLDKEKGKAQVWSVFGSLKKCQV
jgi:hypothetical protein